MAILLAVLLAWFGALTALSGDRDQLPDTAAAQFVPDDGAYGQAQVAVDQTTDQATREHAHLRGAAVRRGMSLPALEVMDLPHGEPNWWREALYPEARVPHFQRLRTVAEDGIRLHAQVWSDLGLNFSPGLVEVPGDVAAGAEWTSAGISRGFPDVSVIQRYRNTSRAQAPSDSGQADRGCLQISSTTEFTGGTPWTWQQDSLWCPGEGMVATTATQAGREYSYSTADGTPPQPVSADRLQDAPPDTSRLAEWQQGILTTSNGDATFGELRTEPAPQGHPVVTAGGAVTMRDGGTTDLIALAPMTEELHWQAWWGRPGGEILSLSTVGNLAMVTTTERELIAFDPLGRRQWDVRLDDVALHEPARIGDDLVVATLGGTVTRYRASDGAEVWSTQLERGVALAPAADQDTVAVVDTDQSVIALDARTGETRWTRDPGEWQVDVAVSAGTVVGVSQSAARAWRVDTGEPVWENLTLTWAEDAVVGAEAFAVVEDTGVRFHSIATGERIGEVPGAVDVVRVDRTWFVLTDTEVRAVDGTGATAASWPLTRPAEDRGLAIGAGRIWVFGRQPGDVLLTGEWFGVA